MHRSSTWVMQQDAIDTEIGRSTGRHAAADG
jgi:hypothetical protein